MLEHDPWDHAPATGLKPVRRHLRRGERRDVELEAGAHRRGDRHLLDVVALGARGLRLGDGVDEGLTRDDILDNITLCWLTNTAISCSRIYWENKFPFLTPENVSIPVAVSAFPDELYQAPKSWAEKAYPKLVYYKKHDKGGHFAAWEQPQLLSQDVREGFRSLRT